MRRTAPLILLALLLGACSLAGDLTPPPALATAQAQGLGSLPTATPLAAPDRPPNPAEGERIFADRCAPCHGETGGGDGIQSVDLPNPPTSLRQLDVAQRAIPEDWFVVVTQGRFDRFMPGFSSLDDGQRWDVVGYALSLGLPQTAIEQGRRVYQAECAACHGADGRGIGAVEDLTTTSFQADRSWLALYGAVTNGAGEGMPGFAESLTDDDRWAVAAFLRSLWLLQEPAASPSPVASATVDIDPPGDGPVATVTAEIEPEASATSQVPLGVVGGRVRNGTDGAVVPADLDLILHGLDGGAEVVTQTGNIRSDGSFSFPGLEIVAGRLYAVTTEHQGVLYASDIGAFESDASLDLPLTIYETTTSTEAVRIGRLHLLLEFPAEGVLQVVELWLLSNVSDRTVADSEGAIQVDLPAGAGGLNLDGGAIGERFVVTEAGFRDRRELIPGENTGELIFSYSLAYDGSLDFVRPVGYPVAAVVVLGPDGGPTVTGEGLIDAGVREVGGTALHNYSLGSLGAGEAIALTLRGRMAGTSSAPELLPVALGAGAFLAALIGAILLWRGPRRVARPAPAPTDGAETVLWAIASLDNEFDQGQIDAEAYRQRRRELVRRIRGSGGD